MEEPVDVEPVEPTPAPVEEPVAPAPVEPVAETPVEPAPVETPAEEPAQPRAAYVQQDASADLLRKIEQMRQSAGSDADIIDQLKKLLDDIE